jgi:nickel superoxide dismutase
VKTITTIAILISICVVGAHSAFAHCEVPCGIYDDEARVKAIQEHITTIEKAMISIEKLSKENPINYNQIVRWTMNKEKHAEELQHVVTQYFMTQRIKPSHDADGKMDEKYVHQLTLLHMMLVHAMKAKQTTDTNEVEQLRDLIDKFSQSYFDGKK